MKIYIDMQLTSEITNVSLNFLLNFKETTHVIGDVSKTGIKLNYSQCNITFPDFFSHDINEVADNFFTLIEVKKEELIEYIEKTKSDVLIYFVIQNYENEYLYMDLSKENIKRFAELSASISIDGL